MVEAVLSERLGVGEDLERGLHELVERAAVVGVTRTEDHVGPREDLLRVARGNAHHVADDLERQGSGDLGHEVARSFRKALDHRVDHRRRSLPYIVLGLLDHFGREALLDDAAQAGVLGIIHVDHRAEELADLDG